MRRAARHASAPPYRHAPAPSPYPHHCPLLLLLLVVCAGVAHAAEQSSESCVDGACSPVADAASAPLASPSLPSTLSAAAAPQSAPAPSESDSTQSSSPPAPVPEASGAANETSVSEEDTPFDTIASLFGGPPAADEAEKSTEPTNRTCAAVIERDERFPLRGVVLALEDEQQIEEIISGAKGHPWLHVFLLYSNACPFSDLMQAEADRLATTLPEAVVCKLRHDHIHYLFTSGSFGVALYPTTLIYRSGDLIGRIEGLKHAPLLAAALAEYSVAWPAIPYEPEEEHATWKIEGDYFTDERLVWAAIAGLAFSVLYLVAERRGYFEPAAVVQAIAQAQAVPNAAAPVPG